MKILFSILSILIGINAYAQLGFNNPNPHASAILDIESNNKGVLIPRLTSTERIAIVSPAQGLLVYDSSENQFYYWNGSAWLTAAKAAKNTNGISYNNNVAINTTATTNSLEVNGAINTTTLTATSNISAASYSLNSSGNGMTPQGAIIMWSGVIIPTGWALCDGTNSTPDLRDKFIVSVGPGNSFPSSGGSNSVTLSVANLPAHSHSASVSTDGAHTHDYNEPNCGEGYSLSYNGSNEVWDYDCTGAYATTSNGNHTHTVTIGNTGSTSSIENRPPYYSLAFIMKK